MARRIKLQSDPALAKPHAAGAPLVRVQPSLHEIYGLIFTTDPRYWGHYLRIAERDYAKLKELDPKILELPVDNANARLVTNDALIEQLIEAGSNLVIHLVLSIRHLILEVKITAGIQINDRDDLNTQFVSALKQVGFTADLSKDPRYGKLSEMFGTRDRTEHPTENNVYNHTDGGWDQVPLAWTVSGKAAKAYESARGLLEDVAKYWEVKRKDFDKPGTLNVTRGLRSIHSVKKSPRTNSAAPPASSPQSRS